MNFLTLNIGIFEFDSDGLFVSGFDVETLNERFDFQTNGREVILERVDYIEGLTVGDKVVGTGKSSVADFHVFTGGGDEVDSKAFPLFGVGRVDLELDAALSGSGVDDLDLHGGGFLTGDFVDSCISPQVPKETVGSEEKASSNW